LKLNVRH